jgi:hypothetical protein
MRGDISLRGLVRKTESLLNQRRISRELSRWKASTSLGASHKDIRAHVMLTRNNRYVDLAEICIQSFFHYHPNATFTLHCDNSTVKYVNSKFQKEITEGQIQVLLLNIEDERDWQEQKLDLILAMNGSSDIFLDADLRWNGALNEESGKALFLVKEFELRDKSPFREILTKFDNFPPHSAMKNVSVFSFGGHQLSIAELSAIRDAMDHYRKIIASPIVGSLDKAAIGRVIEQFALSVCSEIWGIEISYVKESDAPLDGGKVESCYFGATGGTF